MIINTLTFKLRTKCALFNVGIIFLIKFFIETDFVLAKAIFTDINLS